MSFGAQGRGAEDLRAATVGPQGPRGWEVVRGQTRKTTGPTGRAALPCCAEAAREWQGSPAQREPRLRSRAGGVGGLSGHGRPLGRESGAPGGCPRDQGGDPAPQAGADRARSYPRKAWAPGPAGSWFLGALGSAAQHMGHLPSGASSRGSHLRDWQLPEDDGVGEGGWPGGGGRGLEAGAGSAAASSTRSQCGKLRRWRTRQETFRPSGGNTKTNGSQGPAPARLSPRPLQPVPASPWSLAPTSSDLSLGLPDSRARTERWVLLSLPPPPPPPPPPPQLTLPALAAIVTLTETYRVHRHGNAHPFQGPSSAVSRAVVWRCHVIDAVEAMFVTGREEGKLIFNMVPAPSLLRARSFKAPDNLSDHFS